MITTPSVLENHEQHGHDTHVPAPVLTDVHWIVLAWVTMEGVEVTGRYVDRLHQVAETRAVPLAKACTWRYGSLSKEDIAKAIAYAAVNGYRVFTYSRKEKDPLPQARAAVLRMHSQSETATLVLTRCTPSPRTTPE